jgi:hypothetical protein
MHMSTVNIFRSLTMSARKLSFSSLQYRLVAAVLLVLLAAPTIIAQNKSTPASARKAQPDSATAIDSRLIGVWGVDQQGGYDFRAAGTFIMERGVTYRFDASKGVWHYWQPKTPGIKMTADYKISADGKSLSINLKAGKPFTNLKKIK